MLNAAALEALIEARGVKQWLLARRLGVDRKTVYRWLSGKTPRISAAHLRNLAELLGCGTDELLLPASAAPPLDAMRWHSAWLLSEAKVTDLVGSSNNFAAAAEFLESTIDPGMPIELQGALRLQLGRVFQRLHRMPEMRQNASFALETALSLGDVRLERRARFVLSTAELMQGSLEMARSGFERHIELEGPFLTRPQIAPSYANLAACLSALGCFEASIRAHEVARACWAGQLPMSSTCIALFHFAQTLSEAGQFDRATQIADECEQASRQAPYERQGIQLNFLRADILSGQGRTMEAAEIVDAHLAELTALPNYDIICQEFALRAWRLCGNSDKAQQYGAAWSSNAPADYRQGRIALEVARLALQLGDKKTARAEVANANGMFRQSDAPFRIGPPLPLEYWAEAQRIVALSNQSA